MVEVPATSYELGVVSGRVDELNREGHEGDEKRGDPTPAPSPLTVHAPTLLVGGGQRVDSSGSISNHLEQKVKPDESGRDIYVVGADRASVWASGGVAGVESGAV